MFVCVCVERARRQAHIVRSNENCCVRRAGYRDRSVRNYQNIICARKVNHTVHRFKELSEYMSVLCQKSRSPGPRCAE
jgi:hypothetical protein